MSDWLTQILARRPGFEAELVERYTQRLLALARRQLPERVRSRVDAEDVVQSVYRSFFRRLNEDRFSFADSHDVWRLLPPSPSTRHAAPSSSTSARGATCGGRRCWRPARAARIPSASSPS